MSSKAVAHTGRRHSAIGPSAAHRWAYCARSVRDSERFPDRQTFFALEGTAAHEFVEYVMANDLDPQDWLGGRIVLDAETPDTKFPKKRGWNSEPDLVNEFPINIEMVEGAELYRDVILDYMTEGAELHLETFLDLSHIHPDFFGTGDAAIWQPKRRNLVILDYKYGRGYAVDVEGNLQLGSYGLGWLKRLAKLKPLTVTFVIIQPRAHHIDGPVRIETRLVSDMHLLEAELSIAAHATMDKNAEYSPGDCCRYCRAAPECIALRDHVFKLTKAIVTKRGELKMPKPTHMTSKQLGEAVRHATIIEGWFRAVLRHAHSEALDGNIPDGTKLVEKRTYRKFRMAEEVIEILSMYGFDESDYIYAPEPELVSPAAFEKRVGKKMAAEVLPMVLAPKQRGGLVLAVEEDDREAIVPEDGDDFGEVDDSA